MSETWATSSSARHEVFAHGASGGQDVAVALANFGNQLTQVLAQEVTISSVVGNQYLVNAFGLGSCFSNGTTVLTGNQYVDVSADGLGSRYNIQGSLFQAAVVMFSNYKDAHLDHLRFVLQFIDQLGNVGHFHTRLTGSRRFNL